MKEVEIRFERERLEGIVALDTYLIDAAKRFGIHFEDVCQVDAGLHFCSVAVSSGAELLSSETKAEKAYFREHGRGTGERLACQVKIEKAGEVVIMTEEKVKDEPVAEAEPESDKNEQYRKEFAELPLEKQIANLVRLETIAFGETVSFIINSPFKIADKLMDVMAEFGFRKEEREREAVRPEEHKAEAGDPTERPRKKKSSKHKDAS